MCMGHAINFLSFLDQEQSTSAYTRWPIMCPHQLSLSVVIKWMSLKEEIQEPFVFKICINQGELSQTVLLLLNSWFLTFVLHQQQGPVVQSIVSLTSSLRVISLTVLADSIHNILIFFGEKMWVAFALQKLLTFFQQKISAYLRITRLKF